MNSEILDYVRRFFPESYDDRSFVRNCEVAFRTLAELMPGATPPRIPGRHGTKNYSKLLDRYGTLPRQPSSNVEQVIQILTTDLVAGAVNWRCPDLQYNLGAAVNTFAAVMYAVGLDINIYLINDGLAGNCVVAEKAVGQILAKLAGVPPDNAHGVFTFGGTGTMAYAMKVGTRKAEPNSGQYGLHKQHKVLVTEDAHFSHPTSADWLGIGTENLIIAASEPDRRTSLADAEMKLREIVESGAIISSIVINGGTTYDHTVDRIADFAALRDHLVDEYHLAYCPHLHVDSVVGWVWLFFQDYDFEMNPLEIEDAAQSLILEQYSRIREINYADSWGVDFHKGAGGCPIDCSMVVMNARKDLLLLKKGGHPNSDLHQLASEFSFESPVDYTLETSRAGGKALAALASLHGLGQIGYQAAVANLIEVTLELRRLVHNSDFARILNDYSLGYQSMLRIYPPEMGGDPRITLEQTDSSAEVGKFSELVNKYLKAFFSWDNDTRMDVNGGGFVYSFSKKFITSPAGIDISGLKIYPTSPLVSKEHMHQAVKQLEKRKAWFDKNCWENWEKKTGD